jgi:hypothetical protein
MTTTARPVVERAIPPALVTRLGNPVLGWLLSGPRRAAKVGTSLLLLHVTGRRTGTVYSTPVAYHRWADGSLVVLTSSGWRVNLRGGPTPVELTLLGRRLPATAVLEEDPAAVAEVYAQLIDEVGLAKAGQRLGIRINVDRAPTHDELVDAVRREHLSVVRLRTGGSA